MMAATAWSSSTWKIVRYNNRCKKSHNVHAKTTTNKNIVTTIPDHTDKYDLAKLANESGSYINGKLTLRQSQGKGRGIFVTDNLRKGEMMLRIPLKACLIAVRAQDMSTRYVSIGEIMKVFKEEDQSLDKVEIYNQTQWNQKTHEEEKTELSLAAFPWSHACINLDMGCPWDFAIACCMRDISKMNKHSSEYRLAPDIKFWKKYLEMLPRIRELSLPFCMSAEALSMLQHDAVIIAAKKQKERINMIAELCQEMSGSHGDTETLIRWYANVRSRAFQVDENTFAFIPFLDQFNHSVNPNCAWDISNNDGSTVNCTGESGWIDVRLLRDVSDGEELRICYHGIQEKDGKIYALKGKTNRIMMAQYGFVPERNSYDKLEWSECEITAKRLSSLSSIENNEMVSLDANKMRQALGDSWEKGMKRIDAQLSSILSSLPFTNRNYINRNKENEKGSSENFDAEAEKSDIVVANIFKDFATKQLFNITSTYSSGELVDEEELLQQENTSFQVKASIQYSIERKKLFLRTIEVLDKYIQFIPENKCVE